LLRAQKPKSRLPVESKKSTQVREALVLVPQGGKEGAAANISAGYSLLFATS
jgi:hypothetical protein